MPEKMKWSTIKVPVNVQRYISQIAKETGKSQWKIVMEAVSYYAEYLKRGTRLARSGDLDKVSYYIMKLSIAMERFKMNPSDENLKWIETVVSQIKERLGVDISFVVEPCKAYLRNKSKENYVEINMSWKLAISELIQLACQLMCSENKQQ